MILGLYGNNGKEKMETTILTGYILYRDKIRDTLKGQEGKRLQGCQKGGSLHGLGFRV